ncbi:MAG: adenylate/guanylate cyclase domain-containing protein, partial [Saprospiraceae bacterium]|nr:adenylate/guanylate cyclase domain-containing protein [Saprospiraceae bacterium]
FGLFPCLKASLHIGNVVRAEIGDVKTQIVLHGDAMNTTARILEKSHESNNELLCSVHLIYRLELPKIFKSNSIGVVSLKGKEKEIELFSIEEEEVVTI